MPPFGLFGNLPPQPGLLGKPQKAPSGFERLLMDVFAGPADPRLTPEQNALARRRALTQAGLSMIQASGPSPVRPQLAQILGAGAMAGMQAAPAFQQQALQQAQQAKLMELAQAGDIGSLQQIAMQAAASGDHETAQAAAYTLQAIGGLQRGGQGQLVSPGQALVGPDGQISFPAGQKPQDLDIRDLGDKIVGLDPAGNVVWSQPKGTQPDTLEYRRVSQENALLDDYRAELKQIEPGYRTTMMTLQQIDEAKAGDGAAQVSVLYGFIKAMDPNSVVREGEIRLAQEAASLRQRAMGLAQKYAQGEAVVVPGDMVEKIEAIMRRLAAENEAYMGEIRQGYVDRGASQGVPAERFRNPTFGSGGGKAASGPAKSPAEMSKQEQKDSLRRIF